MVIELFGLPGAGKSTLARALADADTACVQPGLPSRMCAVWYAARHPVVTSYWSGHIIREAYRTRAWRLVRFKCALLFTTFAQIAAASNAKRNTVLDEGMLQRMLSIYETKRSVAQMRAALRYVPLSDALVHVAGNDAHHFARYHNKSNTRAQFGDEYLAQWEAVVRHNYHMLLSALDGLDIAYCTYDPAKTAVADVHSCIYTHAQS